MTGGVDRLLAAARERINRVDPGELQAVLDDRGLVIDASSLAAASLVDLGLERVADLKGGYQAWAAWRRRSTPP